MNNPNEIVSTCYLSNALIRIECAYCSDEWKTDPEVFSLLQHNLRLVVNSTNHDNGFFLTEGEMHNLTNILNDVCDFMTSP